MSAVIGYRDARTRLGQLVLDVLVTESIEFPSSVSQYPVEDGAIISDHITQGSETVQIAGTIAAADVAAFSAGADGSVKLLDVVEQLRRMHKERTLVTVSTGQMLYEDFAFASLSASRSAGEGGNWIGVKAELVKVRKVKLQTADVPAERAQGAAAGRAGQTGQRAGISTPSGSGGTTPNPANNSGLRNGVDLFRQPTELSNSFRRMLSMEPRPIP